MRCCCMVTLRCLVVDDNLKFLETARDLLDGRGISIVGVAANSTEAIERLADLRPDVCLIDVHLGEESGLDLARRISAVDPAGSPRVILVSIYPECDLAETLSTGPTVPFVSKVDLSASTIRTALGLPCNDEATD